MSEQTLGAKTAFDLVETFFESLKKFRKTAEEVILIMDACGKEELADIFCSALVYFEYRYGEDGLNLQNTTIEEIGFFNMYISLLNSWMNYWVLSTGQNRKEFEKIWKEANLEEKVN